MFRVTTNVVNENLRPFAATVGGIGNSLINEGGGFEPVIYRTRYLVAEDAPDRVIAGPGILSNYDSLREGFLDGASVHVYRIENGKFRMVREDRIAADGFHVSGWNRAIDDNVLIAPDSRRFSFRWDDWNRPNTRYYFTVRAVGQGGNLSAPAAAIEIVRPANVGLGAVANSLIAFKPSLPGVLASKTASASSQLPAPKNLTGTMRADGALILQWDSVDDSRVAGYVAYRSDYPPSVHKGHFIQLTREARSAEHIRAGDMVIVSKNAVEIKCDP